MVADFLVGPSLWRCRGRISFLSVCKPRVWSACRVLDSFRRCAGSGSVVSALADWHRGVAGRCSYSASRATDCRLRGSRDIGCLGSSRRSDASAQSRQPSLNRIEPFGAIPRDGYMGLVASVGFCHQHFESKGIGFLYSDDEPLHWIQPEIPGSRPSACGDSPGVSHDVRVVEGVSAFASGANSCCSFPAGNYFHLYWCLLFRRTCLNNKREKLCVFFMLIQISQTPRLF